MKRAAPTNAKISVPVDLRYAFDGDVLADQAVSLHLAAVPRVAGTNLQLSIQRAEGLEFSEASLSVQKAAPAGVYRKQLAVTRRASGPAEIVVLVTMDVAGGSAFGFFSVPLDSVKQN
jgi:hypothetical protein